jgi:GWxTD domain-containing protein
VLPWSDTLGFYVEAYGAASDSSVTLRALDESGNEVWRSVPAMRGDSTLRFAVVQLLPGTVPPGRLRIEGVMAGAPDTVRAPVLVSFTDQWMIAEFQGLLNLLRYSKKDELVRQMRAAPDSSRARLWQAFWKDTDLSPSTPQNEELVQYFTRLQKANTEYRERGYPGWLTDRGEVYVRLGEPDEVFQMGSDFPGQRGDSQGCRTSCPTIGWRYTQRTLVLIFVYDSKLERYRLDPSSRREFERAWRGS